jgi:2',3'-cyclic-nucleotide 2'-phosphodiesterase (5'-nucleotidase family)
VSGSLAERMSAWPADLVVLYAGEHKGSLQTCGCPKRPRGSLARLAAWNDAVRQRDAGVSVHAGYFLEDAVGFDGVERSDVSLGNGYMARGLALGAWDALNVGFADLPGLARLDPALRAALPLVSANVRGPGVRPYVVVERGGRRVGITGITRPGVTLSEPPGTTMADPVEAAGPVLAELAGKADVVVLLSYQGEAWAQRLAQAHPAVDVVVDANLHRDAVPPATVGRAAWVRSSYETMRAGELRLDLDAQGAVVGARDRKIDLDPDMPGRPDLTALQVEARRVVDAEQQRIFGGG